MRDDLKSINYLLLLLLFIGCEKQDTKLQKKLVGTWTHEGVFQMTLASDGTFFSKIEKTNKQLNYFGTWVTSNDLLLFTITNKSAINWTNWINNSEQIGKVDQFEIIGVNESNMTLEFNSNYSTNKISYKRRK